VGTSPEQRGINDFDAAKRLMAWTILVTMPSETTETGGRYFEPEKPSPEKEETLWLGLLSVWAT
jgi:hypothetical protein